MKILKLIRNSEILNFLQSPGDSISKKTLHGGSWVFLLKLVTKGISFIRIIILANLLRPEQFGIFGIGLLVVTASRRLARTGINEALIQKKENIEPYLDTAWTVRVIKGIFLSLLLFFGSGLISTFFSEPKVLPLLRVLSLSVLFNHLRSTGVIYFQKELLFHKRFIYLVVASLSNFAVAVSIAFLTRSVWSLVAGIVTARFVKCVMSYFMHPHRPRFDFNFDRINELFDFGKWVFGYSSLSFLTTEGDDVFVGRLMGSQALGIYQMAYRVPRIIRSHISKVISTVVYPALSKLQTEKEQEKEGFLKSFEANLSIVFPLSALTILLAPEFVTVFLGEEWASMIPLMRILSAAGLVWSFLLMTGPLFQANGMPNLVFWAQTVRLILVASFIYPLTQSLGLTGVSLSILVANIGAFLFSWIKVLRILSFSLKRQISLFIPIALPSLFLTATVWYSKMLFQGQNLLSFFIGGLSGVLVYFIGLYLFWKLFKIGPVRLLYWFKKVYKSA